MNSKQQKELEYLEELEHTSDSYIESDKEKRRKYIYETLFFYAVLISLIVITYFSSYGITRFMSDLI